MKFNVDFEAVPYVAEKVTPNKDGSVWTFTLRKDSKWSDGSPCSARDFEYSFKRQLDPATAAPYASFLYDIKNGEAFNKKQITDAKEVGVRAKDDWTLEVTLEGPRGYFPVLSAYSAALPGHKGSIEKYGDKWTEAANIVGNGPFVLDVWEHNKVIILKKNKHFFGAKDITLEKVTIPIIPIASGVLPYENNEIDLTRLQTADLKRFQSDPKTAKEVFRFPYPGTWYLLPQVTKPPFDNLKVRQAVAYAIPYQKIMDAVLFGLSKPMFGAPAGKTTEVAWPQPHAFNTDIEKAKALMAEAGYADGFSVSMMAPNNRYIEDQRIAQAVAAMLAKINIKVDLQTMPKAQYWQRFDERAADIMMIGWQSDTQDSANFYEFLVMTPDTKTGYGQYNAGNYSNPEVDRLTLETQTMTDPKVRAEILRKIERILYDDAALVPLHWQHLSWVAAKSVHIGPVLNVIDMPYLGDLVME